MQALPLARHQLQFALFPVRSHAEGLARFRAGQDTDQTFLNPVLFHDFPHQLLLVRLARAHLEERPPGSLRNGLRSPPHPRRKLLYESLEALKRNPLVAMK